MRLAKAIAVVGLGAMTGVIVRAFIVGNFNAEGDQLLKMPWGVVSLVDLYVGFTLFSGWIVYREKSWPVRLGWIVLMMTLGNWTAAVYVFWALQKSNGNWKKFWLGSRA